MRFTKYELLDHFIEVRHFTEIITASLEIEDFVIQVTEEVSPAKWHLAHTTWFFETFFLEKYKSDYTSHHPEYSYLFNSYYLQTGVPHCRARRGTISRPTVRQVFEYRKSIDEHLVAMLNKASQEEFQQWAPIIEIGIHHEQQHQELLLTDLKFMFSHNPLNIAYKSVTRPHIKEVSDLEWVFFDEGVQEIGHDGDDFGYDNEFPKHKTYLPNFGLAKRLVTNGEFIKFIESGAYNEPKWWLDEGFSKVRDNKWESPLYWRKIENEWWHYTLCGMEKVDPMEPVTHVSYFEADAYARWCDCRLPTEQEWEHASTNLPLIGSFADSGYHHPVGNHQSDQLLDQMFGELWQWTQSSYSAYPGYKPLPGALGEYNGKFMCNQYVLRGGSCATSKTHYRKTYRNFFHAHERWQFTGIRLAK